MKGMSMQSSIKEPISEFRGEYYFLNNSFSAPVMYQGLMYRNSEAAFQSAKVRDKARRKSFIQLPPNEAKKMGQQVKLRADWEKVKDNIMFHIVWDKFARNVKLKNLLLATGDRELIEENQWNDTYWGVCRGEGQNKLGKMLMKVRKIMRELY